jgi:hypothetical protein
METLIDQLCQATREGKRSLVLKLLKEGRGTLGPETNIVIDQLADQAAQAGHRQLLADLIGMGASDYDTIAASAALGGHRAIVEWMLKKGATDYDQIAARAAEGGYKDIVDDMLALGAIDYDYLISSAQRGGHSNLVEYLRRFETPKPSYPVARRFKLSRP